MPPLQAGTISLRSRVGRRLLALFVACALVPTIALMVVAYRHVTAQLLEETDVRLRGTSKTAGMEIMLHLQELHTGLDRQAASIASTGSARTLEPGFVGLGLSEDGAFRLVAGEMHPPAPLPEAQALHIASGRISIVVDRSVGAGRLLLVRQLDPAADPRILLWAELTPAQIWSSGGAGSLMGENQDLCVFDGDLFPLTCTRPMPPAAVREASIGRSGSLAWETPTGEFIGGHFTLFLGFEYGAPSWTVVVSESRGDVLAPLAGFRRSFLAIVLLTLGTVVLLSISQIRRSLTPLEELTRGTRRLAAQDFSEPVVVPGRDEFGQLADSFNSMAEQLQSQFGRLQALHAFDRAALAAKDREGVVTAILEVVEGTVGSGSAALALPDTDEPARWRLTPLTAAALEWRAAALPASMTSALAGGAGPVQLSAADANLQPLFAALDGDETALAFPLRHAGELTAVLLLGLGGRGDRPPGAAAQQLADQVSLALSRVQVMEELHALNRGTLIALARAIDANSPWTAGHSERVSAMAVHIGRSLGLSTEDLDKLEIGGLIHDVGKIGVSADIINKPGTLTEAEYEAVRAHTTLGASILAPVRAYQDLLPLVRSHHELLDGTGYPDGLSGEQIPPLVRVMTVADIFDALVSKRPYRDALPLAEAVALLRKGQATKFDTRVVDGFLYMLASGHADIETLYPHLVGQVLPEVTAATERALLGRWT